MKGVILAAGDGGRLRSLTLDTPKVLLEVGGHPLIHYPLHALRSVGITEIAVVLGYNGEKIVDAFEGSDFESPAPTFIINPQYQGGTAISVEASHSFTGNEPFVLCMGDHIIGPEMVDRLLRTSAKGCVLCVDLAPRYTFQLDDGTRVRVGPVGDVLDIGKDLEVWNGLDVGVFMLTAQVYSAVRYLRSQNGLDVELSQVVRILGLWKQSLVTCDVSGLFWGDMDTVDDYRAINRLFRVEGQRANGIPFPRLHGDDLVRSGEGTGL